MKSCAVSKFAIAAAISSLVVSPSLANAQEEGSGTKYVDVLRECQKLSSDSERLACFDEAAATIVNANDSGDLQVLDKQDIEKTRRSLFGFSLPNIKIFGGGENASKEEKHKRELLETVITSVHYAKPDQIYFVTAEGATWRISNAPSRLRTVKVGQPVVFKQASMGSFFIRINGQIGVKGRRVR